MYVFGLQIPISEKSYAISRKVCLGILFQKPSKASRSFKNCVPFGMIFKLLYFNIFPKNERIFALPSLGTTTNIGSNVYQNLDISQPLISGFIFYPILSETNRYKRTSWSPHYKKLLGIVLETFGRQ